MRAHAHKLWNRSRGGAEGRPFIARTEGSTMEGRSDRTPEPERAFYGITT